MTRDDILDFLRTHKQEMQLNYGVAVIGLFGSYARQAARDDGVAVGTEVTPCPPHRSLRAELPHKAPASGV